MLQTDLATLRQLPGVVDAAGASDVPLGGPNWIYSPSLGDGPQAPHAEASMYFADTHTLATLGLQLVAGRNFRTGEVAGFDGEGAFPAAQCIVTRQLGETLRPGGGILGQAIYILGRPCTVVGVIAHLQGQLAGMEGPVADSSVLLPLHSLAGYGTYVVRTRPGEASAVAQAAPRALLAANHMRLVDAQPYADIRAQVYERDRGMAIVMGAISVVLLAITAAGIVGLTSFWVGQRRRQIGIRRALGATRHDILHYFLTENLLIGTGGVVVGVLLALGLNLWLILHFQMARLPIAYLGLGVVVLLLLGQGATLAPALRASRVPPVEATRSV
jgi:putative ABC transport system permease protein